MKAPKLVTLADLRRAVPKGWFVDEYVAGGLWRPLATIESPGGTYMHSVHVYHHNRQTARRVLLAALKALKASR